MPPEARSTRKKQQQQTYDLVVASYVLGELPTPQERAALIRQLWGKRCCYLCCVLRVLSCCACTTVLQLCWAAASTTIGPFTCWFPACAVVLHSQV